MQVAHGGDSLPSEIKRKGVCSGRLIGGTCGTRKRPASPKADDRVPGRSLSLAAVSRDSAKCTERKEAHLAPVACSFASGLSCVDCVGAPCCSAFPRRLARQALMAGPPAIGGAGSFRVQCFVCDGLSTRPSADDPAQMGWHRSPTRRGGYCGAEHVLRSEQPRMGRSADKPWKELELPLLRLFSVGGAIAVARRIRRRGCGRRFQPSAARSCDPGSPRTEP